MTALAIVFWVSAGLILYLHFGYVAVLAVLPTCPAVEGFRR